MFTGSIKPLKHKKNTIFEGLILLFYNHPCYGTLPSRVLLYICEGKKENL